MHFMIFMLIGLYYLFALTMRIMGNPHKNIVFENTLPKDKVQHPQVLALRKEFKRQLLLLASLLSILSLPLLLIRYDSLMLAAFLITTFSAIAIFQMCQVAYIRKMRQLIVENHWELPVAPLLIDTQLIREKNKQMVSKMWLWLNLLLVLGIAGYSLIFMGSSTIIWILTATFLLIWVSLAASYYYIGRMPVKPLTNNQELNRLYNDATKYYWSATTVIMCYLFLPMLLFPVILLSENNFVSVAFFAGYMLVLLSGVAATLYMLFRLRRYQDSLLDQAESYRYSGDDHYWRYGIYINPHDARVMVPDRIGFNMSINLGNAKGKAIAIVTAVVLFFTLCIVTVPLFMYDFGGEKFQYTLNNHELTFSAPLVSTKTIDLQEIKAVELINQLPDGGVRMFGTATDRYLTGQFDYDGKTSMLYIDKENKPILKVQTASTDYYYTNDDPEETEQLYQQLSTSVN